MPDEDEVRDTASWLRGGFVDRRTLLKAGAAVALGGPLLAACTSSKSTPKPSASSSGSSGAAPASGSASPAAESFSGITINVACNPTDITPAQNAGKIWGQMTGATVNAVVVPYAERATDYATMIVDQNSHYDVLFGSVDFVSQFSDKLYVDLTSLIGDTSDFIPAALGQLSQSGKLYCAPLFADEELFWFNKTDWTAAGLDPTQIPTTWDEMYALAPKLTSGKREACVVPWDSIGVPFWLCYYNSTGGQLFNADKTQLMFDNDNALSAWQAIGRGFDAKWYGSVGSNAASDQDTATLFNQHLGTTQINIVEYFAQYGQKSYKSTITPAEVGVAVMPGITAGTSGSVIVSEGFGINKFGKHQDAALSFVKYVTGADFQKQVALGMAGDVLPPSRKSVNADPTVQAGFPFGTVLNQQSSHQLTWPGDAPFDWNAPFVQALTNLSKGTWTPQQCQTNTVNAVHKLIVQNLGGS